MDTLTSEKCPYSPLPRRASRGRQSHGALEDTTSSCDQSMERRGEQERRKRRGNATASQSHKTSAEGCLGMQSPITSYTKAGPHVLKKKEFQVSCALALNHISVQTPEARTRMNPRTLAKTNRGHRAPKYPWVEAIVGMLIGSLYFSVNIKRKTTLFLRNRINDNEIKQ